MNLQHDEVLIRYALVTKGIKEGALWVWFYRNLPNICLWPMNLSASSKRWVVV